MFRWSLRPFIYPLLLVLLGISNDCSNESPAILSLRCPCDNNAVGFCPDWIAVNDKPLRFLKTNWRTRAECHAKKEEWVTRFIRVSPETKPL